MLSLKWGEMVQNITEVRQICYCGYMLNFVSLQWDRQFYNSEHKEYCYVPVAFVMKGFRSFEL